MSKVTIRESYLIVGAEEADLDHGERVSRQMHGFMSFHRALP